MENIELSAMKDVNLHPIKIDYQLYTDGDPVFKKKLLSLMVENLQELLDASDSRNTKVFGSAAHKARPTLLILEDGDFNKSIDDVRILLEEKTKGTEYIDKVNSFKLFCERIINSLQKELDAMTSI